VKVSAVELGDSAEVLSGFAFKSEFFSDNDGMPLIRVTSRVIMFPFEAGPFSERGR